MIATAEFDRCRVELSRCMGLAVGWDGYDAPPPNGTAISWASFVLGFLLAKGGRSVDLPDAGRWDQLQPERSGFAWLRGDRVGEWGRGSV